jgi:hypothetical protein
MTVTHIVMFGFKPLVPVEAKQTVCRIQPLSHNRMPT